MAKDTHITRTGNSWRVRVPGFPAQSFADSKYGGQALSLSAARRWRDERWDGRDRRSKLTPRDRAVIRRSKTHYVEVAERYGITPNYVHELRRGG